MSRINPLQTFILLAASTGVIPVLMIARYKTDISERTRTNAGFRFDHQSHILKPVAGAFLKQTDLSGPKAPNSRLVYFSLKDTAPRRHARSSLCSELFFNASANLSSLSTNGISQKSRHCSDEASQLASPGGKSAVFLAFKIDDLNESAHNLLRNHYGNVDSYLKPIPGHKFLSSTLLGSSRRAKHDAGDTSISFYEQSTNHVWPFATWLPPQSAQVDQPQTDQHRSEAERLAAEQLKAEQLKAEQLQAARLEAQRLAQAEAERIHAQQQRLETERFAAEQLKAEQLKDEQLKDEQLKAEQLKAELLKAKQLKAEQLKAEQLKAEQLQAARLEAQRLARAEAERIHAQQQRLETERFAAEQLKAEQLKAEQLKAEQLKAELLKAEQLKAEQLKAEQLKAELLKAEQLKAEQLKAEQLKAEQLQAARLEAQRLARAEAERIHAQQQSQKQRETRQRLAQETQGAADPARRASQNNPFVERAGVLWPSIRIATVKLERMIEIPSGLDSAPPFEKQSLQSLPVHPNFMLDVDNLSQMRREIRRLDALIASNPNQSSSHYLRGNLHYRVSDLESAQRDYSRSLELQPSHVAALVNRGAVRRKTGDLAGAIIDYTQAITLSPADRDAYRNRGIARELSGDIEGAHLDWQRAAQLGDDDASQWLALASLNQGPDLATQSLIRMHQPNPVPTIGTGQSTTGSTSMEGRLKKINLALMSRPTDIKLLYQRGTEFLKQGNLELAIGDFSTILQIAPTSIKALFNRAVARRQAGDLERSLSDYDKVIELSPQDHDAYRNRGIVKQLLGSQAGACADWGTAAALGNADAKYWVNQECK